MLIVRNGINGLDTSGLETRHNLPDRLRQSGIFQAFSSLKFKSLTSWSGTRLTGEKGVENIYPATQTAIAQRQGRRQEHQAQAEE